MAVMIERRDFLAGSLAVALAACNATPLAARPRDTKGQAKALIEAARKQIGVTLAYAPGYSRIGYPGGDISRDHGVCTDVVIRAYRDAFGLDLQRAVHEDMARAFARYPHRWGLAHPDSNIDHRRVPNLAMFWQRAGAQLPIPKDIAGWQPGDLFTSLVGSALPHTGIISDQVALAGGPMVIHNIGRGAREEGLSNVGTLTGRFRWRV